MEPVVINNDQIRNAVDMKRAIELLESSFKELEFGKGSNLTSIFKAGNRTIGLKIGYLDNEEFIALKSLGLIVLAKATDPNNPVAIMDSKFITWMRTGAAGAVAAKYLAARGADRVGIIGSGRQGRAQLMALNTLFKFGKVKVWSPTQSHRKKYADEMSKNLRIEVEAVESAKEAVVNEDLVVTATTSNNPIVKKEWVTPGTHVNAIGASHAGGVELDSDLIASSKIYTDDTEQALRMGAVNVAISKGVITKENIYGTLGQVITGRIPGRVSSNEITMFDCSGLGTMDVALAVEAYKKTNRPKSSVLKFE